MALYAFDGTWNSDRTEPGKHTNVLKFYNAYQGAPKTKSYFRGIGNKDDYDAIRQILGGVSGLGGKGIIGEAYRELAQRLDSGDDDPIDIVGFSRGAALGLHFANVVEQRGIPILGSRRRVVDHVRGHRGKYRRTTWHYEYDYQPAQPVRFLGCWDTVASFGLPGNSVNLGYKFGIPGRVQRACHAMALDEHRKPFQITRLDNAEEVWFMGRHSNVGGGYPDAGLSDITLEWMIQQAQQCSVPFYKTHLAKLRPDTAGTMPPAPGRKSVRIVYEGDKAHRSVVQARYPEIDWDALTVTSRRSRPDGRVPTVAS